MSFSFLLLQCGGLDCAPPSLLILGTLGEAGTRLGVEGCGGGNVGGLAWAFKPVLLCQVGGFYATGSGPDFFTSTTTSMPLSFPSRLLEVMGPQAVNALYLFCFVFSKPHEAGCAPCVPGCLSPLPTPLPTLLSGCKAFTQAAFPRVLFFY